MKLRLMYPTTRENVLVKFYWTIKWGPSYEPDNGRNQNGKSATLPGDVRAGEEDQALGANSRCFCSYVTAMTAATLRSFDCGKN